MTKQEFHDLLAEYGITDVPKGLARAFLDKVNAEKSLAVEEATETARNEVKESFKDYKSSEDYKKLLDENAALKDESKKVERYGKYKNAKIKEKWLEHADSKLKDSINFDEDLKKYLTDYPELLENDNPVTQPSKASFSGLKNSGAETTTPNKEINNFIRGKNNN